MSKKAKIIRVLTYVFELVFFAAAVVFVILHDASMGLASLAMSEICRLHRDIQNVAFTIIWLLGEEER